MSYVRSGFNETYVWECNTFELLSFTALELNFSQRFIVFYDEPPIPDYINFLGSFFPRRIDIMILWMISTPKWQCQTYRGQVRLDDAWRCYKPATLVCTMFQFL